MTEPNQHPKPHDAEALAAHLLGEVASVDPGDHDDISGTEFGRTRCRDKVEANFDLAGSGRTIDDRPDLSKSKNQKG